MIAGLLTQRIKVITPQLIKNDFGEEETIWVDKYTTRARLVHKNGNRAIENNEVVYDYSKTFEIRSYVPIEDFDRIIWNNKQYRILDIEPNEKNMNKIINVELVNE